MVVFSQWVAGWLAGWLASAAYATLTDWLFACVCLHLPHCAAALAAVGLLLMPPPSLLPLPPSQLSAVFYDRVLMMTIANNSPAAMVVGECLPACLPACLLGAGGGGCLLRLCTWRHAGWGVEDHLLPPTFTCIFASFICLRYALCAMNPSSPRPPRPPAGFFLLACALQFRRCAREGSVRVWPHARVPSGVVMLWVPD